MSSVTSNTFAAPGSIIAGKYRVERVLGEGGMGVVVHATHLALDEPVAIKFLRPEVAQNEEAAARFTREAKAALRVKSEHIGRVLDIDRLEDGLPYIVMEFLEGTDLDERIQRAGRMGITEAVDAVIQACIALSEAHAQGVIHRDIKPANLFETRDSRGRSVLKVLDFGISKVTGERARVLTAPQTAMGSVSYMSPEQLMSSGDVDHRTDIYALGVTLYELLTGVLPFVADTIPQIVALILNEEAVPVTAHRPDVPAEIGEAVRQAMSMDAELRQATVLDLAETLRPFASARGQATLERFVATGTSPTMVSQGPAPRARTGGDTTQAVISPSSPTRAKRTRWWLVPAGGAIASVVIASAMILGGGDNHATTATPTVLPQSPAASTRPSSRTAPTSDPRAAPAPPPTAAATNSTTPTASATHSPNGPSAERPIPKPPAKRVAPPPPRQPPPTNIKDSWP